MQMFEGESTALQLFQPGSLVREASDMRLHWQAPNATHHSPYQPPHCFPSNAADKNQSDQYSDDSAALYTSSTGYSHSPPLSPRSKRPCRPENVRTACIAPLRRNESDFKQDVGVSGAKSWLDSPVGTDTPDHQREMPRIKQEVENVRQRAASELYGLRRLRASPRWALEAAQMSDDSRSAGQPTA